ncbi:MAG: glycoside hydrolase family 9 protein [Acidobacteriaceae bacterium]
MTRFIHYPRSASAWLFAGLALAFTAPAVAQTGWVRVNQAGYEAGQAARAYLMTDAPVSGVTFKVKNLGGHLVDSGIVGASLGTWAHSATLSYSVYPIDFSAPPGNSYKITVSGPVSATSPPFAVDTADVLYPGFLLNTLFFYQTERDGPDYIPNALRTAPGHLKDENARRYLTPPIDDNGYVDNEPPAPPLVPAKLPNINAAGGWWDAGDYMKYVEDETYVVAMMELGVRDFPNQMGNNAPVHPPAPPVAVSYAGDSGDGAPYSSDFTGEAAFGLRWLMRMWDDSTSTLSYQVDNSQDWDYYGMGDPASTGGYCGGAYPSPYCLITEYDIWTLPQTADTYDQPGDPEPCDPQTTFYICNRAVFVGPPGGPVSPNLAGRLTADFALCYQINHATKPVLAATCLREAEHVYSLADLTYPDPAPFSYTLPCPTCLLTTVPPSGETVWDDDMEWGATELYFALALAQQAGSIPAGLPVTDPAHYLGDAAQFARNYVKYIYKPGFVDTLNLLDVSGLAHFELYRALKSAGDPGGLAFTAAGIRKQLLAQVGQAVTQAQLDPWGFGEQWDNGDVTSRGAGLSVMASEAYWITGDSSYNLYAQRWLGNILGANSWGSSFIVGDGTTFPNCIQHQVANLAGSLDGTSGGTPILWGASSEGPADGTSSGVVDGMNLCPANGGNKFAKFNGNDGAYDPSVYTYYKDNMQSYTTTEPAIDLTATSFLMWSWRHAQRPAFSLNGSD